VVFFKYKRHAKKKTTGQVAQTEPIWLLRIG
jgi:hypothetical protein